MIRPLTGSALVGKSGWTAWAFSCVRTDDNRFSDEEILTILHGGEAGLKVAEVCDALRISVATYNTWKAKYSGLTPAEVRSSRLRERRKGWAVAGLGALIAVGFAVGGLVILMGSAPPIPNALVSVPGNLPPPPPRPTAADIPPQALVVRQPLPATGGLQPAGVGAISTRPGAGDIETGDPSGYSIQVAAVPNFEGARVMLEQLAGAGYPAYVTAKTIDRVELFRVRVGPLKSREVAEDVARRLEGDGHHSPWITR